MYIQCLIIENFQEKCLKNPKRCKNQKQKVFWYKKCLSLNNLYFFYKKATSSWIKGSLSDFVSFSCVDFSTVTLLKSTWTVKALRIKSFETFLIEMNEHFIIFWFWCTRFLVSPATCSVRCDKQTIIVSFDGFTSLPLVFRERPGQIFSKVKDLQDLFADQKTLHFPYFYLCSAPNLTYYNRLNYHTTQLRTDFLL